jgi:hypothetical protein
MSKITQPPPRLPGEKDAMGVFTPDEVKNINAFQRSGRFHPMTCGGNRNDESHLAYARVHGVEPGLLIATEDFGLICPACDYCQEWAHDFMKQPLPPDSVGLVKPA